MDDVYNQHIYVHPSTIHITFATKSCFCNYKISTHYLPHVLNESKIFKMILNVEKKSMPSNSNDLWCCHLAIPKSTIWHYEIFWVFNFFYYSNIDLGHPLWTFILNGFRLWHMVQSKFSTWHINYILEKNQSIFIWVSR